MQEPPSKQQRVEGLEQLGGALGRLCWACWHIFVCGLFVLSASDVSEIENLDELEVYGDSDKAAGTTLTSYIFEVRARAELYSSVTSRHTLAIPCSLFDYLQKMCLWWSLCTLYLLYTHARWEDVPLVEFVYLVFTVHTCQVRGCASGGVCVPCIYCTHMPGERMYFWWSLCTLYLLYTHARWEDVPLVEFVYLVFTVHTCQVRGCASGGVSVHVRVTVGNSGLCCCVCVTSFNR